MDGLTWKFDNIPKEERNGLFIAYKNNNYDPIKKATEKHNVAPLGECTGCNANKKIKEWFGFLFEHFPNWKNGQDCN